MNRLSLLVLLLGALASIATAASAPTFCKCTCFTNSTIIEIKSTSTTLSTSHLKEPGDSLSIDNDDNDEATSSSSSSSSVDTFLSDFSSLDSSPEAAPLQPRGRKSRTPSSPSPSCNQCNRAFCFAQSLPICKGATDKDVVTMCFQRDSRKDMIIVWGFLLGTAGLLGWAALRKGMEVYEARPSGGGGGGGNGRISGQQGGAGRVGRDGGEGSGGAIRAGLAGLGIARSGMGGGNATDAAKGRYVGVAGHSREGSASFT